MPQQGNTYNNVNNPGYNTVNTRLGVYDSFSTAVISSTRRDIDNSGYYVNSEKIPINGLDITFPTTAETVSIASTSANDNPAGTGAIAMQILGLNANWDYQIDTVLLNGQTKVLSNLTFIRINNLRVVAAGSTGYNEGDIYISNSAQTFSAGEPTTIVYSTMAIGCNFGLNGILSIPRGFKAVATNFKCSTDATSSKPLLMRAEVRLFGLPVWLIAPLVFDSGATTFINDGVGELPEKTDIIIRSMAKTASGVDLATMWWSWSLKRV